MQYVNIGDDFFKYVYYRFSHKNFQNLAKAVLIENMCKLIVFAFIYKKRVPF